MQAHRGEIPLFPPALQEADISLAGIPKPAAKIGEGQAQTILNHPCCYTHNWWSLNQENGVRSNVTNDPIQRMDLRLPSWAICSQVTLREL